jgi:S1-C subfamily serine protease
VSAPLVQLDAAVIVGNSGGLLFTLHARLVGIVAAHERIAESIAFALPVDHVRGFLRAITAEGGRRSGALGVQLGLDRDVPKPSFALGCQTSLVVASVLCSVARSRTCGARLGAR